MCVPSPLLPNLPLTSPPTTTALLNVFENLLNILYLYLTFSAPSASPSTSAPLVAFTSASLTLAKTILYWAQEYYCSYCSVGHNTVRDLVQYWIIPNGFWIVVPAAIVWTLGRELLEELKFAQSARKAGLWVPGEKVNGGEKGKGKSE
jgi:hypothetical protein